MAETETAAGSFRRKMSSHVTALAGPAGHAGGGGMEREPSCCPAVDKTGTCRIPGPRASILTGGRHAAGGCPPAPPGSPRLSAVTGWAPAVPSRLLASTPHLTALLEMADFLVLYVVGFFFCWKLAGKVDPAAAASEPGPTLTWSGCFLGRRRSQQRASESAARSWVSAWSTGPAVPSRPHQP